MSAEDLLHARVEAWLQDHRSLIAIRLEEAMSHLQDLIDNGRKLAAERTALISDRDAQKSRADAAEAHAADLQAKIDADDKTAGDAASDLAAEIAKEAGVTTTDAAGSAVGADVQANGTATTTITATGARVTVDPADGTTTHVDTTGTTTVVPHDGTAPSATDSTGAPVEASPAAVAEATSATQAAGV